MTSTKILKETPQHSIPLKYDKQKLHLRWTKKYLPNLKCSSISLPPNHPHKTQGSQSMLYHSCLSHTTLSSNNNIHDQSLFEESPTASQKLKNQRTKNFEQLNIEAEDDASIHSWPYDQQYIGKIVYSQNSIQHCCPWREWHFLRNLHGKIFLLEFLKCS